MVIASLWLLRTAWIVTALIWLFASVFSKPTMKTGSPRARLAYLVLAVAGGFCIGDKALQWGWLGQRFLPFSPRILFIGALLTSLGCILAIWSRVALGSNWSGGPAVKQGHVLIQQGPYALSRHPIYTGFLTAVLGTTFAVARYRAGLGFVLVLLSLLMKITQEEKLMTESFPEEYPRYRNRVRALVPWVL
jgi:protein-S-isoprenylcysteine O-methyltransferase Ste14